MPTQEQLDAQQNRATETDTERRSQTFVGPGGTREERIFEGGSRITQNNSSWGGSVEGAIFDVSTNTYTPKTDNQQGIGEDTSQRGVDSYQAPVDPTQSPGGATPNTTVGLCVNGTPYLIDINASDLYAVTEDPNFPPVEP